MNIKFVLCFILLFSKTLYSGSDHGNHLGHELLENIMKIWTKIDTVRAINTDPSHRPLFLEELINDSFDVYYLSRQIKKDINPSQVIVDYDLLNLLETVQNSFEEVFLPMNSSQAEFFSMIIQKIFTLLKIPQEIEAEISSQDIG